jgi:hypothetical protein
VKNQIEIPSLPQSVSNDGREIWDWAAHSEARFIDEWEIGTFWQDGYYDCVNIRNQKDRLIFTIKGFPSENIRAIAKQIVEDHRRIAELQKRVV